MGTVDRVEIRQGNKFPDALARCLANLPEPVRPFEILIRSQTSEMIFKGRGTAAYIKD